MEISSSSIDVIAPPCSIHDTHIKMLYSLAQQKRPRFPLLTKLISTADQIILKGKVTSFWQQFKAFLLYKLTLLTNSSIPFLPWNS